MSDVEAISAGSGASFGALHRPNHPRFGLIAVPREESHLLHRDGRKAREVAPFVEAVVVATAGLTTKQHPADFVRHDEEATELFWSTVARTPSWASWTDVTLPSDIVESRYLHLYDPSHVVWLKEDVFLSNRRPAFRDFDVAFTIHTTVRATDRKNTSLLETKVFLRRDVVDESLDTLFQVLLNDKFLVALKLDNQRSSPDDPSDYQMEDMLHPRVVAVMTHMVALGPLAHLPFELDMTSFHFTQAQWRDILIRCPDHILLVLDGLPDRTDPFQTDSPNPLVEAVRSGSTPKRLRWTVSRGGSHVSQIVPALASAFTATSCPLEDLQLAEHDSNFFPSRFARDDLLQLLLQSIGCNRRLTHLDLCLGSIQYDDWLLLWNAIGSHPTLRSVQVRYGLSVRTDNAGPRWREAICVEPQEADNTIWQAVRSNHVLETLEWRDSSFRSRLDVQQNVQSHLHCSRLRRHVKSIQQHSDNPNNEMELLRRILARECLLGNRDGIYFLLRSYPDLIPIQPKVV